MKTILFLLLFSTALVNAVFAQEVTYSETIKEDNRNMNFEILGNFNGKYIIYKNVQHKHRLTLYDRSMKVLEDIKLNFISDKTFNVDFITYPDYFLLIYQFQKGNNIYCNAAKIDGTGHIVGSEIGLDTTKISFWADNKIYFLTNSEDKQKILLYRMLRKNDSFTLSTTLFNAALVKLAKTSQVFDYNERRETYGDLEVDNEGTYYYIKETSRNRNDYTNQLQFFYHKQHADSTFTTSIPLHDHFVDDVKLKIDNLNRRLFINAFSYKRSAGPVEGLFTVVIDKENFSESQRALNLFDDSLRTKLTDRSDWRTAFDNFYIRNIVLKKDSGILVNMEQYFTQNRGYNNSAFNRGYYYDPFPYSYGTPGYYRFQRSYYDYYGSNNYRTGRDVLYNYSDLLIFNFTKDLKLKWNNIINKKQNDVETDNFLSYATLNMGSEIHYLFVDKNKQVISDFALQQDGFIKRYATIKSGEVGYTFMPRLLKQVSARQVIVPCQFRNYIAFAKIDFSMNP